MASLPVPHMRDVIKSLADLAETVLMDSISNPRNNLAACVLQLTMAQAKGVPHTIADRRSISNAFILLGMAATIPNNDATRQQLAVTLAAAVAVLIGEPVRSVYDDLLEVWDSNNIVLIGL